VLTVLTDEDQISPVHARHLAVQRSLILSFLSLFNKVDGTVEMLLALSGLFSCIETNASTVLDLRHAEQEDGISFRVHWLNCWKTYTLLVSV